MYFSNLLIVSCKWIFGLINKHCVWYDGGHFTVLKSRFLLFILLVFFILMLQHINSEFQLLQHINLEFQLTAASCKPALLMFY